MLLRSWPRILLPVTTSTCPADVRTDGQKERRPFVEQIPALPGAEASKPFLDPLRDGAQSVTAF